MAAMSRAFAHVSKEEELRGGQLCKESLREGENRSDGNYAKL